MSRIRIFIGVSLIVAGVSFAPWGRAAEPVPAKAAAPAPPQETERERALKQLLADKNEEIDKLKAENEHLKQKVRNLKERKPVVQFPMPELRLQPPAPAMLKNAIPREFNGETYYLVPLNSANGTPLQAENQNHRSASNLPVTKTGR